jgi:hypothetical protein
MVILFFFFFWKYWGGFELRAHVRKAGALNCLNHSSNPVFELGVFEVGLGTIYLGLALNHMSLA